MYALYTAETFEFFKLDVHRITHPVCHCIAPILAFDLFLGELANHAQHF